ncbi:branched-chain amino acid ABC transporter permease [Desulfobacula sp.]|uniref:branched-chain amino acid ABC transporter permease n=1 Tax=Desulfobacula sp. TaxID=2593537 RepID=UPI0026054557|nr:branched-chain amino acid ABC transporter permease [Desulfobacula sp.]
MNKFAFISPNGRVNIIRIFVLIALGCFPLLQDAYLLSQLTVFLVYGLFAMSLSLIWGYGGILCFGHAVFFGIGAYIMALTTKGMIPGMTGIFTSTLFALLLSIAGTALFASILGYFLFSGRLSGPYFGIVTLAVAVVAERIATKWDYIGGFNGLTNIPAFSIGGYEVLDPLVLFYVILGICLILYLISDRIVNAPFGTILSAVRDNEDRVEFFGYNIANLKILIFSISAGIAGLAGALFAVAAEFVSPTILGFSLSTEVLIWVALGGREILLAAFLGAISVRTIEALLSDILGYYWILGLGVLFILCVMFFPRGLFGQLLSNKPRN